MNVKKLVPLTFGAGALIALTVTGIHTGASLGDPASFVAGASLNTSATYTTPHAPAMLLGQTAGEEPNPVVTTAIPAPQPGR